MNTNEDKHLEKLIDNMMKDVSLESPSLDFTSMVMSKISKTKTIVYKPLIPKSTFLFLIGCLSTILIYSFFNGQPLKDSSFDFSSVYNKLIKFSPITIYSTVIATTMLFIQIAFLKNYFNKQFEK
jgi:hypothetical protein